jgi:hypothetical protein
MLTFPMMQPPIVALGPSNVSSPMAVNAERPDRMLPAVSTSTLVSSSCLCFPLLLSICMCVLIVNE